MQMDSGKTLQDYQKLFDLPEAHTLTISSTHHTERDSTVFETRWLEEHDQNNTLIARFRTWCNRSLVPPYRRQLGWERYCLSGNLLDREVRYSKRDDMQYLH